jgi:hypothetical protein
MAVHVKTFFGQQHVTILNDISDNTHDIVLGATLLLRFLQFSDTCASCFLRNIWAAYRSLTLSHAGKDINILCSNEEWTVRWYDEPTVDLPDEVQEEEERPGEVQLEEELSIQVGTADGVERNVELCNQA